MTKFEFSEEHNITFNTLAKVLLGVTGVWLIAGSVITIEAIVELFKLGSINSASDIARLFGFILGPIDILIGYYAYQPIDNLKNIVSTQGQDIENLMIGLDDFSKLFNFLKIGFGLNFIIILVRVILYLL